MTSSVCASIATRFKMDRTVNLTSAHREDCVARLVSPLVNLKAHPAKREHLRHEGHAVKLSVSVERRENFLLASYLYPIADSKLG